MRFVAALVTLCAAALAVGAADEKIKVLVIDGQNNHNWKQTTPVLKKIFEDTGRFTVDVASSPPQGKKEEMAKFRPELRHLLLLPLRRAGGDVHREAPGVLEDLLQYGRGLLPVVVVLAVDDEHLDLLVRGPDRERGGTQGNEGSNESHGRLRGRVDGMTSGTPIVGTCECASTGERGFRPAVC